MKPLQAPPKTLTRKTFLRQANLKPWQLCRLRFRRLQIALQQKGQVRLQADSIAYQ